MLLELHLLDVEITFFRLKYFLITQFMKFEYNWAMRVFF